VNPLLGGRLPNFMIFSVDYKPQAGGIAEHAHKVAQGLTRAGASVVVLAPRTRGSREFDRGQDIPTFRVPRLPILDLLLYFAAGCYLVRKHRIGVIYVATSSPCAPICAAMRLVVSFKYTVTIHAHEVVYEGSDLRHRIKKLVKPLQIAAIRSAHRVFAVSEFTRRMLVAAGVPASKISTIFNGIDPDDFEGEAPVREVVERLGLGGKRVILTVARLDIHKGQDMVMRALPAIIARVPEAVYVVVGEGKMRSRLLGLATELGVERHVVLTGGIPRVDVIALMKVCDVFVMASRLERGSVEGFGIVFLEAGILGKPVVGGRSGGIPDAVEDGSTGFLVDPESPDEIAQAVARILEDRNLAARLGAAGQARTRAMFTWDEVVGRIVAGLNV
jgi:phosphatidylinositol alpha-1,6-mannosyltransferase